MYNLYIIYIATNITMQYLQDCSTTAVLTQDASFHDCSNIDISFVTMSQGIDNVTTCTMNAIDTTDEYTTLSETTDQSATATVSWGSLGSIILLLFLMIIFFVIIILGLCICYLLFTIIVYCIC